MRKIIAGSGLLGGFLAVALFASPVAQAMPPVIPPEIALNCGKDMAGSGAYDACVTVVNETRGFVSPGVTGTTAGLAFTASGDYAANTGWTGGSGQWVLGSAGEPTQSFLQPNKGWVAYSCRIPAGNLSGCSAEVTTTLADPENPLVTNPNLQEAAIEEDTNSTIKFKGKVEYSQKIIPSMWSCVPRSKYVMCDKQGNYGPQSAYQRYDFALRNATMGIKIINFLDERLVLNKNFVDWNRVIPDSRGETPSETLASGQQNSARSIAPYVTGYEAPDAHWGGITELSTDKKISMTYDVAGSGGYAGVKVKIEMKVKLTGGQYRWDTEDACKVTGPSSNLPKCEVTVNENSVMGKLEVTISSV